ncbi:hypothetical protein ES703_86824 [subsurface metagenome]
MKQEKKQNRAPKIEESLSYTVEVRDKKGRVIQRISAPSHSYVEQWNQLVQCYARAAARLVKDTDGVEQNVTAANYLSMAAGVIGEDKYGIRVGKGTTAVAIDDYALGTPCDEGTGLNEFEHQAVTLTEPSVVGSTCSFTAKRILVNNSGVTISGIKEIGGYLMVYKSPATYPSILGFRDVLPSAVYVPHGGSITVTYTMAVTV